MTTIVKTSNKKVKTTKKTVGAVSQKTNAAETVTAGEEMHQKIDFSLIDFSPLNYRKYYSQEELNELAADIAIHGIIHALIVRQVMPERYELVVGERRLRASAITGLKDIPVVIRQYTDEQVNEIQLSENIHRSNPHPMNEAQGIGQMLATGKNIEEIAIRLGKSKQFVYTRIKLLSLIEPLREMFVANAITLLEALELATLSDESQADYFEHNCTDWRETEDFQLEDLKWTLRAYKTDLKNAPFDPQDETLLPNMGACNRCPFNSASLVELFPEMAKSATCDNKQCYQNKCNANQKRQIEKAFEQQPEALIFDFQPTGELTASLMTIAGAMELPQFFRNQVSFWKQPLEPQRDQFMTTPQADDEFEDEHDGGDWEEWNGEQGQADHVASHDNVFDEQAYTEACEEYQLQKDEFGNQLANGNLKTGVYFSRLDIQIVYFMERNADHHSSQQVATTTTAVTAKAVKEAEKQGNATIEIYDGEIERLKKKEERAKEIDEEKFQLELHQLFSEHTKEESNAGPTTADLAAAKLIILNSLGWHRKKEFAAAIGIRADVRSKDHTSALYEALVNLSDQDFRYLIRLALAGTTDTKQPNCPDSYFLFKASEQAGVDVDSLRMKYESKARDRESRMEIKIHEVEKKKDVLTGQENGSV